MTTRPPLTYSYSGTEDGLDWSYVPWGAVGIVIAWDDGVLQPIGLLDGGLFVAGDGRHRLSVYRLPVD